MGNIFKYHHVQARHKMIFIFTVASLGSIMIYAQKHHAVNTSFSFLVFYVEILKDIVTVNLKD